MDHSIAAGRTKVQTVNLLSDGKGVSIQCISTKLAL